jgi:hypothetical protein
MSSVMGGFDRAGVTYSLPTPGYMIPAMKRGTDLKGHQAVLFGGNNTKEGTGLLYDVISNLREVGIPIIGYVPASGARIDNRGTIYWTEPPSASTEQYK